MSDVRESALVEARERIAALEAERAAEFRRRRTAEETSDAFQFEARQAEERVKLLTAERDRMRIALAPLLDWMRARAPHWIPDAPAPLCDVVPVRLMQAVLAACGTGEGS